MSFYTSIARYYDYIFPLNNQQVTFVEKGCSIDKKLKILDVGCATGSLAIALENNNHNVTGIDLNDELIDIANNKKGLAEVNFAKVNMLELDKHFAESDFDRVVCFGNTLVHLENENQVESFMHQAWKILKPGGLLQIQVINYDRILDENIKSLQTIDNEHIKFTRNYQFPNPATQIEFKTSLEIKHSQQVLENTETLLALRQQSVFELINKAGFKEAAAFGSFNRQPHLISDVPLIVEAIK